MNRIRTGGHLSTLRMVNVGGGLGQELPDIAVPVEEAARRVRTEPRLVRVQGDRVRTAVHVQLSCLILAFSFFLREWSQLPCTHDDFKHRRRPLKG